MPVYLIQPQDLLFFRDARPMEPESPGGGQGARWPHPAIFFDAIHAALWRAFPDAEHRQRVGFAGRSFFLKRKGRRIAVRRQRTWFHTLATAGPFPVVESRWLFPAPADVLPEGGRLLPITEPSGVSIPPSALRYALGSTELPSKATVVPWWSKEAVEGYLARGTGLPEGRTFGSSQLFAGEWTTGIGTDPLTDTQDGERIYSAQYLRLREDVRFGLWATLPKNGPDGMDEMFPGSSDLAILVAGGQQRFCHVQRQDADDDLTRLLPVSRPLPAGCTRLKWVLLSPAVFPSVPTQGHGGGWLPTWIHPGDHGVLLNPVGTDPAVRRRSRSERRRAEPDPDLRRCRLVAARIPKPVPITGWTEALHVPRRDDQEQPIDGGRRPGPRATQLAVPAGAVYYFECPTERAARLLWGLLSWHGDEAQRVNRIVHRRSSLLGEKGFGLGICSCWEAYETMFGNR
ncbi:MAG: hypothetical protein H7A45_11890 [Verrucomicrobiales bacterium]|nr:hypothetical protein [Verrucomicrobiales bacterium]MCP5525934.1 hypothetical protein [Verrucomicrobiales bacterium]